MSGKKAKILIVDDEPDIGLTMKFALESADFEVDTFTNPDLALENFKAHQYDLIIIDFSMPQMNGVEFYRRIKKIDDEVKVCFFTAFEISSQQTHSIREELTNNREIEVLQKPFDIDGLLDKTNSILKK